MLSRPTTTLQEKVLMKSPSFSFFSFFIFTGLVVAIPAKATIKALHTAATGMATQEANVNTISNNLANVKTIGHKRERAESEDLLYQTIRYPGARSSNNTLYSTGIQVGSGSKISAIKREFSQGSPKITEGPFDLMLKGDGFFGVILPDQTMKFTRDGAFKVSAQGEIVNNSGFLLAPGFNVPQGTTNVNIAPNGNISAYVQGQKDAVELGSIPVFTFTNPGGLSAEGGNLFRVTEGSGDPVQNTAGQGSAGTIRQGALENSNVSVMKEMTELITAQRAYEMNSKVMKVADEMLQTVNNIR